MDCMSTLTVSYWKGLWWPQVCWLLEVWAALHHIWPRSRSSGQLCWESRPQWQGTVGWRVLAGWCSYRGWAAPVEVGIQWHTVEAGQGTTCTHGQCEGKGGRCREITVISEEEIWQWVRERERIRYILAIRSARRSSEQKTVPATLDPKYTILPEAKKKLEIEPVLGCPCFSTFMAHMNCKFAIRLKYFCFS